MNFVYWILFFTLVGAVIAFFVVRLRKPTETTFEIEEPALKETPILFEESPESEEPEVLELGDQWLEDNHLNSDTYGEILNKICGLSNNLVAVKIVNVDLKKALLTISVSFQNTNVNKITIRDIENLEYRIDPTVPVTCVTAKIVVSDDIFNDSPDYDSSYETAIERFDWDLVMANLIFELHMSQDTHNRLFPSAA